MLFSTALTWLFLNILSLRFFGCVGRKFRNLSLWHNTSLLVLSCSFHCDLRSRVFHNTLSASLQGHMKADFKENNVRPSWWKVRHFLSFEHFVYFSAYFTYFVQIPLSGGNMCVILQSHFFAHLKFYVAVCKQLQFFSLVFFSGCNTVFLFLVQWQITFGPSLLRFYYIGIFWCVFYYISEKENQMFPYTLSLKIGLPDTNALHFIKKNFF